MIILFYSNLFNCCSLKIAHWERKNDKKEKKKRSVNSKECCIKIYDDDNIKKRFILFSISEIRPHLMDQKTCSVNTLNVLLSVAKKSIFIANYVKWAFFEHCNTSSRTVVPIHTFICPINTPHEFCRHHTHLQPTHIILKAIVFKWEDNRRRRWREISNKYLSNRTKNTNAEPKKNTKKDHTRNLLKKTVTLLGISAPQIRTHRTRERVREREADKQH